MTIRIGDRGIDDASSPPGGVSKDSTRRRFRTILRHQDLHASLIILAVTVLVCVPMFVKGFPAGPDAAFHFRWVNQFSEAWREPGVFYPRWFSSANNGQGSPVMIYYPPTTIFLAATFKLLIGDTLHALSLASAVGLALSGLTMYAFSRSMLSIWPSLFAALLYILAPYHLFDLYQGSALAEFWSFAWLPLVLDATRRVARGGGRAAVAYLGLSLALLLLTHIPISLAFFLILPLYVLVLTRDVRSLIKIAAGVILGLLISAVFLLPVLFERGYVNVAVLLRFSYKELFLFEHLRQALKARFFMPNLSDLSNSELLKTDSQLYLLKTEQAALGSVVLIFVIGVTLLSSLRKQGTLKSSLIGPLSLITGLGLLMTTKLSATVWKNIPQLPYMQFPSRFLVFATLGSCLLTAVAGTIAFGARSRFISAGMVAAAVVFNLWLSGLVIVRAPYAQSADIESSMLRREVPEYRTVWWDGGLREDQTLPPVTARPDEARIQVIDDEGINQRYVIESAAESELKFRTLYFPGWTARVDGNEVETKPSDQGSILVRVGPGQHTIELNLEGTWPRNLGKVFSAIGLAIMATCFIADVRRLFQLNQP